MPIVDIAQRGNTAVGRGLHELKFSIATSKKFNWIEPYIGLNYVYAASASDSPIREVDPANQGQVFINPPMRGEFTVGTEFIPYEDKATGARYGIDLRFSFGYTSEGRDYTPCSTTSPTAPATARPSGRPAPVRRGGQREQRR